MQIVDNSRKILFMSGKEIHWHANVWYMERFNFAPERVNPRDVYKRQGMDIRLLCGISEKV